MANEKWQMKNSQSPRVAIVHDWLIAGGAERVVLELHRMYPDAPIYTSYCSKRWRRELDGMVRTGFLQYWPFSKLRKFVPFLRAWWFGWLDLREYDLVISSSGAEAKGIRRLKPGAKHVAYIHAPTHYYWSRYEAYLKNPGFGRFDWLARIGLKLLVGPLRRWDLKAAGRPDLLIANSTHTQQQIRKYYHRDADVIFPPVDVERFTIEHERHGVPNVRRGFVITGRQTPYKRIDLAVRACSELGVPLIVIGKGPEHRRLKKMAGKTITFLTRVTDHELPHYLQSAEAFVFPGLDDFGIAPVEAMAAGTPVIAFRAGGALDYVVPGKTGEFFDDQTVGSLTSVLQAFNSNKYSSSEIKTHAFRFGPKQFQKNLHQAIKSILK